MQEAIQISVIKSKTALNMRFTGYWETLTKKHWPAARMQNETHPTKAMCASWKRQLAAV